MILRDSLLSPDRLRPDPVPQPDPNAIEPGTAARPVPQLALGPAARPGTPQPRPGTAARPGTQLLMPQLEPGRSQLPAENIKRHFSINFCNFKYGSSTASGI